MRVNLKSQNFYQTEFTYRFAVRDSFQTDVWEISFVGYKLFKDVGERGKMVLSIQAILKLIKKILNLASRKQICLQ